MPTPETTAAHPVPAGPAHHETPKIETRWNGEPCTAARVSVIVADSGAFPGYWARAHVGTRRHAVRVDYAGRTFYLDDEDGSGWDKVTHGGGPGRGHRSLDVEPGSVQLLALAADQDAERPLSPYYRHEPCGFHWHGRDGMDIPMRDGQPVCPRCELEHAERERDCLAMAVQFALQWRPDAPMSFREGIEEILATMPTTSTADRTAEPGTDEQPAGSDH